MCQALVVHKSAMHRPHIAHVEHLRTTLVIAVAKRMEHHRVLSHRTSDLAFEAHMVACSLDITGLSIQPLSGAAVRFF